MDNGMIRAAMMTVIAAALAGCVGGGGGGSTGSESGSGAGRAAADTGTEAQILIEFSYDAMDVAALQVKGYRVYAADQLICESTAPYRFTITEDDCDQAALAALPQWVEFYMTVFDEDGHESARSAPYSWAG